MAANFVLFLWKYYYTKFALFAKKLELKKELVFQLHELRITKKLKVTEILKIVKEINSLQSIFSYNFSFYFVF
jgi:hypothetical protein